MPQWLWNFLNFKGSDEALGVRGENLAARFLRDQGYKIIARNFRCAMGEIDIVAREGGMLVFVEVKTRSYDDPTPEQQINLTKQRQITRTAKYYLSRYGMAAPPGRFDVVAVLWVPGRDPQIRHTPGAFEAAD